jgi:hypothetical protein
MRTFLIVIGLLSLVAFVTCGGCVALFSQRMAKEVQEKKDKHPEPRLDKSEAMQQNRKTMMENLVKEGVFAEVEGKAGYIAKIVTGPKWNTLDFETKEKYVSVVYAYYYDGDKQRDSVWLKDRMTNKDIGRYSIIQGGLKLD